MDRINTALGSETYLKDLECMFQNIVCSRALLSLLQDGFFSIMWKEGITEKIYKYIQEKHHSVRLVSRASINSINAKKGKNADQQPFDIKPFSKTQIDAIKIFRKMVQFPAVQMPTFSSDILEYSAFKNMCPKRDVGYTP